MMWYAALVRLLRRRAVLAIIFCLSLTYCLVNLFGSTGSSKDGEEVHYKRAHPLIWRDDLINETVASATSTSCRNSVQGRMLIVDDEGFVCNRADLMANGCCKIERKSIQYSCESCIDDGCCAVYEHCVSCCLHPNKRTILEKVLDQITGRQMALFASVRDQFELCLAKCRTDSHSVQHENKYKNPELKYCFYLTKAHESQRDKNSNKVL